ncbi:MAG: hypothetical protein LKF47_04630 [Megasphaera sp.]|jgi:hypothetical protein|nr:hypothetical protein [Megasphaera sp.]MCI1248127.1 hypothetical protein [Megasphaera sp.]
MHYLVVVAFDDVDGFYGVSAVVAVVVFDFRIVATEVAVVLAQKIPKIP